MTTIAPRPTSPGGDASRADLEALEERIETRMKGLATKGDIKVVIDRVHAVETDIKVVIDRVHAVETKVDGLAEDMGAVMKHLGIPK